MRSISKGAEGAAVHRGGCLCGAVRYEVTGPLRPVAFCHCEQCRRQTGLYYAATSAMLADLKVVGEDLVTWFAASDEAERGFCSRCGSALFWQRNGAARRSILAGSLDLAGGLVANRHIFVGGRPEWYEIADGLPQHPRSD